MKNELSKFIVKIQLKNNGERKGWIASKEGKMKSVSNFFTFIFGHIT